jgi:hypothetical protein
MQAGLLGFAGAAFTFSAEYEKPLWIVISLSACMSAMERNLAQPAPIHLHGVTTAKKEKAEVEVLIPARNNSTKREKFA